MKNFTIDPEHLCSVVVTEYHGVRVKDKLNPTPEELMEILKSEHSYSSVGSEDHPAFAELRKKLGRRGYIAIENRWWNGDFVLKPFRLNGYLFRIGERFLSGSAMSGYLVLSPQNKRRMDGRVV